MLHQNQSLIAEDDLMDQDTLQFIDKQVFRKVMWWVFYRPILERK